MRIIFVRHGEPNYKLDCLTELGKLQAAACAARLEEEPITAVYSSTNGRAAETASYIAAPRGLTVTSFDFMRELGWGATEGELATPNGHPWGEADWMVENGTSLLAPDWATSEPFCRNKVTPRALYAAEEFDKLLLTLGYRREGGYYRVLRENTDTIVMASHGGSGSAVLAHMLGLPFTHILATSHPEFTSITILDLPCKVGVLVTPRIEVMNEAHHIKGVEGTLRYQ